MEPVVSVMADLCYKNAHAGAFVEGMHTKKEKRFTCA
jgi:hypothetical protein